MSTATEAVVTTTAIAERVIRRLGDLGYGYINARGFRHVLCKQNVGHQPADAYRHEKDCEVKQLAELGLIIRPQIDDDAPRSYTCTTCERVVDGDPFAHARQECSGRR